MSTRRQLLLSALALPLAGLAPGSAAPTQAPAAPSRRLVLDYESRDPALYRVVVLIPGVNYLYVRRAWLVGNEIEVEVYDMVDAPRPDGGPPVRLPNGMPVYTAHSTVGTIRQLDKFGRTTIEHTLKA